MLVTLLRELMMLLVPLRWPPKQRLPAVLLPLELLLPSLWLVLLLMLPVLLLMAEP